MELYSHTFSAVPWYLMLCWWLVIGVVVVFSVEFVWNDLRGKK